MPITTTIKALSVKQPWASRIASGEKTVEYRSWATRYRGDILIVASKSPVAKGLPSGMALCIVSLDDCLRLPGGGYGWQLSNVRAVAPFPVRGSLGLYQVSYSGPLR
jgi:hypothetical protein